MQIGKQIQQHRKRLGMTQDDLAERLYVSRQTISNWENDRHYPDIENLLLLSVLFDRSLDELVKGDVVMMKKTFRTQSDRDVKWMLIGTVAMAVATGVGVFLPAPWWLVLPAVAFGLTMIPTAHLEYLKHKADVHTFREIDTFMAGGDIEAVRHQRNRWRDAGQQAVIVVVYGLVFAFLLGLALLPYLLTH